MNLLEEIANAASGVSDDYLEGKLYYNQFTGQLRWLRDRNGNVKLQQLVATIPIPAIAPAELVCNGLMSPKTEWRDVPTVNEDDL